MENVKMIDWQKAIKEIDLVDYFMTKFPNFYYDNNRKAFVDNPDRNLRSNKFVFFKGKDGNINYISRNTQRGGNLISFIKNEIVSSEIDIWKAINLELQNYKSNVSTIVSVPKKTDYNEIFNHKINEEFQLKGEFLPMHKNQIDYLKEDRDISEKTIQDPIFQNALFSYKSFKIEENGKVDKSKYYFSLGYPIYNKERNKIIGVHKINTNKNYNNYNMKSFERGSQNKIGISSTPPLKNPKEMVLCESFIDAMSHYELNPRKNVQYFVLNGEITQNNAFDLKNIFEENAMEKITLAFDNDLRGYNFDLLMLSQFNSDMKINYTENLYLSVSLKLTENVNENQWKKMLTDIQKINTKTIKEINELLPRDIANEFIKKEKTTMFLKKNEEKEYEFIIPNSISYIKSFNSHLIKVYPKLETKIKTEKSISKDWNDDLKTEKQKKIISSKIKI